MELYCIDGEYDDLLTNIGILYDEFHKTDDFKTNINFRDSLHYIKPRVIDLLNERLDLGQKLNEEKYKVKKLQLMIGMLVNKLGKDVVYDALGIHEEKK